MSCDANTELSTAVNAVCLWNEQKTTAQVIPDRRDYPSGALPEAASAAWHWLATFSSGRSHNLPTLILRTNCNPYT